MLEGIIKIIKDILFPVFCVDCKKEGEWWCDVCLKKLKIELIESCPVCNKQTWQGQICFNCKAVSHLDGATAFFSYKEGDNLSKLIKQFKYQYTRDMVEVWKRIFKICIRREQACLFPTNFKNYSIIPVPLHPHRERERGFNQAQLLARAMVDTVCYPPSANNSGLWSIKSGLIRMRNTKQQAKLSGEERRKNLSDAFEWKAKVLAPEKVLLIDDVFTTGATMQECARILKKNGSREVWGLALARG